MIERYELSDNGLVKSKTAQGNVVIFKQATANDRQDFIKTYDLPQDVFDFYDMATIAPRVEYLYNEQLGETMIFVLANVVQTSATTNSEDRLESHTFILGEERLFWFINEGTSNLDEEVFQEKKDHIDSLESLLMNVGLLSYKHFTEELRKQKRTIDGLHDQANHQTSNKVLNAVAETERDMVMLEHTLDTQEEAFTILLKNETFLEKLDNPNLVHDIKWYNRQVNKLVHVYRDLLDTVSALFSDIMSNSLNKIMKFLSSLALIFASSSLIAELWGMNTGGLPFKDNPYGTYIMIGVAFLSGFSMYLFLKKKNYLD